MGMFYTPKPHRFDYQPRFYDPKKEELEKAKKRYSSKKLDSVSDKDLEYYKSVVESFDEPKKKHVGGILHRKELPKFNYKPRFSGEQAQSAEGASVVEKKYDKKIKFRQSWISKRGTMDVEPVSAGKVFLYATIVVILLLWVFDFFG